MRPLTPDQQKRVLDCTMELVATHNLEDVTLDQLTRACGIPAFDIVRHYLSRENILKAVLERELELMAGAAYDPELRLPGETMRDELTTISQVIFDEHRKRLGMFVKLISEGMNNPEVGGLFYRTFIMQGRQLFRQFLERRKERGELRDDLDTEAGAAFFLAALIGALLMVELLGGRKVETLDDERFIAAASEIFLGGVKRE
jgi:AcrR family transcriptional regulator